MSRIKNLREERGWTQEHLGEMLGVRKATVSRYESDIVSPSNSVLRQLSSIFNVSIDYLLGNENTPAKDETTLLKKYRQLSDDNKATLNNLLNTFLLAQQAAV